MGRIWRRLRDRHLQALDAGRDRRGRTVAAVTIALVLMGIGVALIFVLLLHLWSLESSS